jgi:ketosteroid isomerase-like protein
MSGLINWCDIFLGGEEQMSATTKWLSLATLCVFLTFNVAAAATRAEIQATEQLLMKNERDWAQSAVTKDIATFRRLMADDYVELILEPATSTRKAMWVSTTKDEWTKLLKSGTEVYQSVEIRNLHVYLQGDIATVPGEYSQKGTKNGADNSFDGYQVNTWARRGGVWLLVNSTFP